MTRLTLRIDFENGSQIGHGKIRLLELIAEHGSISRAAKEMKMSYRRAWLLVQKMNAHFSEPLVETAKGGNSGGGARLTALGQEVVACYRQMEVRATEVLAPEIERLRGLLAESRDL